MNHNVRVDRVDASDTVVRFISVALRMSINIVTLDDDEKTPLTEHKYRAELGKFKVIMNDTLNLHDRVINVILFKKHYDILYPHYNGK